MLGVFRYHFLPLQQSLTQVQISRANFKLQSGTYGDEDHLGTHCLELRSTTGSSQLRVARQAEDVYHMAQD